MNKSLKKFFWPLVLLRRKHEDYLRKANPEKLFSLYYKRSTGKYLNIDHPKTLDDYIAYMEFRTDTTQWSELADKVKVRDYVERCGYKDNLTKLYGVWAKSEEIDFESLPDSFVIKTNNGSATNILVKDKKQADWESIRKQLNAWMTTDYGYNTAQPHYSKIKPLILAEEFLVDERTEKAGKSLNDYKFYCVNGIPMYVFVYSDRKPNSHDMKRTIYDMEWNIHQEFLGKRGMQAGSNIPKPISFEYMKTMAQKLSSPFPFVRVDFYEINGKPIFGEMTFTPGMQATTVEFSRLLGEKIVLNK